MSESTANPFKNRYDEWMRLNPGAERLDVTTKGAGDFMKPDCQHPNAVLLKHSKYRIKCPDCRLLTRV